MDHIPAVRRRRSLFWRVATAGARVVVAHRRPPAGVLPASRPAARPGSQRALSAAGARIPVQVILRPCTAEQRWRRAAGSNGSPLAVLGRAASAAVGPSLCGHTLAGCVRTLQCRLNISGHHRLLAGSCVWTDVAPPTATAETVSAHTAPQPHYTHASLFRWAARLQINALQHEQARPYLQQRSGVRPARARGVCCRLDGQRPQPH